jgi:hypothetical protein
VQILTVLPNPPAQVMNKIQDMFYKFLWDGKPDKIKRNVIINNYEEGGLTLTHIESFCKALKMSWLHKLLDQMNMSPWKMVFQAKYFSGNNFLSLPNLEPTQVCFFEIYSQSSTNREAVEYIQDFGADSHSITKPSCSSYERNTRHFL